MNSNTELLKKKEIIINFHKNNPDYTYTDIAKELLNSYSWNTTVDSLRKLISSVINKKIKKNKNKNLLNNKNQIILDFYYANPDISYSDIAKELIKQYGWNIKLETLRKRIGSIVSKNKNSIEESRLPLSIDEKIHLDINKIIDNKKLRILEEKYKSAILKLKENDEIIAEYKNLEQIPISPINYIPSKKNYKNEAIAMVVYSDWHCGERIEAATINNINEFNIEIAKKRIDTTINNTLSLINKERNSIEIDKLALFLLGDFMHNYIHEEFIEDNLMSPVQEVEFIVDHLVGAIEFFLKESNMKEIIIPCAYGNHGRTTPKSRVSTGFKNSYEWMIYRLIAKYFKNETRIKFHIPDSAIGYVQLFDKKIRFSHGDNFRYAGGVGGLTIPLMKFIHNSNRQIPADMSIMGNWHQLIYPTKDALVNGCLCGFNAYSQMIGATPEPPSQAFMLLDKQRGFTVKTPIFCENK